MNIGRLPADLETFVRDEIASGHYQSEDELVTEALRLLKAQKALINGDAKQSETSQSNAQLSTLRELVRELEVLPLESPEDGFSVRDHDKLLYGEPWFSLIPAPGFPFRFHLNLNMVDASNGSLPIANLF